MKIAVVHSFYAKGTPSGENAVVEMQVDELRRSGHDVRLFEAQTDDLANKPFYKLRTAFNVATGRGLNPLADIGQFSPDIIHVHNLFPNFSTEWLADCPYPVVATIHNFRPMCAAGTLFRDGLNCTRCPDQGQHNAVINACYRESRIATLPLAIRNTGGLKSDALMSRADQLIFLSPRSMGTYEKYGVRADRCSILPNFVPTQGASREEKSNTWIYAGRLTEEKGILDLLSVWPRNKPLKVLGDGPCIDQAKKIANSSVQFSGSVAHEVVMRELGKSAGLILPSKWAEGLPTVYLEALASRLPVITRVGNSAADDVKEFAHGIAYSDPRDIVAAVRLIEENWGAFSAKAYQRYVSAYTAKVWSLQIAEVYERAISRRRAYIETGN